MQQVTNDSHWQTYQQFISLRNTQNALKKGDYRGINVSTANVYSFLRQFESENLIIAANLVGSIEEDVTLSLPFAGIAPGAYELVDLVSGNKVDFIVDADGGFQNQNIGQLPAGSTSIFKLMTPGETTAEILFQVDMSNMIQSSFFDPATETVDMVSNLNDNGSSLIQLEDTDGDSIYSITISSQDIGSAINYKYRLNGINDGREEYPGSDYLRQYIMREINNVVLDNYEQNLVTSITSSHLNGLNVYPNPATQNIIFDIPGMTSGKISLSVHNISGKIVKKGTFIENHIVLEVSELPSGIYLVNLFIENDRISRRIIIEN